MGGVLGGGSSGPSKAELAAQREEAAKQRKLQEQQMEQSRKLQEQQTEQRKQQESDIAEEQYKLKKKARGRASLLSGGAKGIQETMG